MPFKSRAEAKVYRDNWRKNNPEKLRNYWNKSQKKYREKVFKILGHKCKRCGFDDKRALQFDHINGGGNKHRQGMRSNANYYRLILKIDGRGFQVLCANCNWIKRVINKEN